MKINEVVCIYELKKLELIHEEKQQLNEFFFLAAVPWLIGAGMSAYDYYKLRDKNQGKSNPMDWDKASQAEFGAGVAGTLAGGAIGGILGKIAGKIVGPLAGLVAKGSTKAAGAAIKSAGKTAAGKAVGQAVRKVPGVKGATGVLRRRAARKLDPTDPAGYKDIAGTGRRIAKGEKGAGRFVKGSGAKMPPKTGPGLGAPTTVVGKAAGATVAAGRAAGTAIKTGYKVGKGLGHAAGRVAGAIVGRDIGKSAGRNIAAGGYGKGKPGAAPAAKKKAPPKAFGGYYADNPELVR